MNIKDSYIHGADGKGVVKSLYFATTVESVLGIDGSTYNTANAKDLIFQLADINGTKIGLPIPTLNQNTTGYAAQVLTQSRSTNAVHYLVFVDSNNSQATAESLYTDTNIKYNPNTDTLTLPKITVSAGFNYTGIENATTDAARNVWFSNASAKGTPCYNDNFKFNPASNGTLYVNNISGTNIKITIGNTDVPLGRTYSPDTSITSSSTHDTIPSSLAVYNAILNGIAANDAMVFKGIINGGASAAETVYTLAADRGWTYKVGTAGYINGVYHNTNDTFICLEDSTAAATSSNVSTIRTKWGIVEGNGDYLSIHGGTMDGHLYMKGSANLITCSTGSYANGIRINRASASNWAGMTIGYVADNTGGSSSYDDHTWMIATPANSDNLNISYYGNIQESSGLTLNGSGGANGMKWNNQIIANAGNVSNKNAAIKTSLTEIATIAGVSVKAKIDVASLSAAQYWADQSISTTSSNDTTPRFAKVGIGGAVDNNFLLKVYGNELNTGSLFVTCGSIGGGIIVGDRNNLGSLNGLIIGSDNTISNTTDSDNPTEDVGTTMCDAFAQGWHNEVKGNRSSAMGFENKAYGRASQATGEGTKTTGHAAHSEGLRTLAQGQSSHAEGKETKAIGNNSHSEGENTQATSVDAHAEGYNTLAQGECAHAEGWSTRAVGLYSHAEGKETSAEGVNSHAEGAGGTKASGEHSHAEGWNTLANGNKGHAEGESTKASGENSHAEGYNTFATGRNSHAEGAGSANPRSLSNNTTEISNNGLEARGEHSHAEGWATKAFGPKSHAEGERSIATGEESHAEGKETIASGKYSHTSGLGTKATNDCESAFGKYNLSTTNTIFTVGYGTNNSNRRNLLAVINTGKLYVNNGIDIDVTTGNPPLLVSSTVLNPNLNADLLDGYHASSFSSSTHTHTVKINGITKTIAAPGDTAVDLGNYVPKIAGTGSVVAHQKSVLDWKGCKIVIPGGYNSWMMAFTLRIYIGYQYTDIVFSGYHYGNNHWLTPNARIIGGTQRYKVVMGYEGDTANSLYVWIGKTDDTSFSYGGVTIMNLHAGHNDSPDWYEGWTFSDVAYSALTNKQYDSIPVLPSMSDHSHTLSIAADSGNNQLSMTASTKYKLTAGGSTFIFTTPPHTDKTGIKLGTVSGTQKNNGTIIINNSSSGLTIQGGTNAFKIGDGTNYISVAVAHGLTTKNLTANGTNYAIYTTASSLPNLDNIYTRHAQAIPYIVGSSGDSAGVWTGSYSGLSYVDGLTIIYVPKVAGGANTTLNINNLGEIPCYLTNDQRLGNHFAIDTPIIFTYIGGKWKRADFWQDINTWRPILIQGDTFLGAAPAYHLNFIANGPLAITGSDHPTEQHIKNISFTLVANALNKAGYVAAPSSSTKNQVWMTDNSGNPAWRVVTVPDAVISSSASGTSQIASAQSNPYYNLIVGTSVANSIRFLAGSNISISAAADGQITFTNTGVRSVTINSNYLRVNTNGTNADLTIPYATATSVLKSSQLSTEEDIEETGVRAYTGKGADWSGNVASMAFAAILTFGSPSRGWQMWARRDSDLGMYWRRGNSNATAWEDPRLFLDSVNTSASVSGNTLTLTIGGNNTTFTPSFSDTKVTQSETTTASYRGIVLGYNSSATVNSGITTAVTQVVYTTNKLVVQPSTGSIYSNGTINATQFIRQGGTGGDWITGRDHAMIKDPTVDRYHALLSLKTTNGSWEMGAYETNTYRDKIVLAYCLDSDYNNNNNRTEYLMTFPKDSGEVSLKKYQSITTSNGTTTIAINGTSASFPSSGIYHTGQVITITATKTLKVSEWTLIGAVNTYDAGTYVLQIHSGNMYASGVFSLCKNTDAINDEIPLHVTNTSNGWRPYAKINGNNLQMSSTETSGTSRSYTVKIFKLI